MQRNQGESFADYKARRAAANKATKELLKGTLFHDSNVYGTYEDKEKQARKAQRAAHKEIRRQTNTQLKQDA